MKLRKAFQELLAGKKVLDSDEDVWRVKPGTGVYTSHEFEFDYQGNGNFGPGWLAEYLASGGKFVRVLEENPHEVGTFDWAEFENKTHAVTCDELDGHYVTGDMANDHFRPSEFRSKTWRRA